MSEIGKALRLYANDHEDKYPQSNWCDVLVGTYELKPRRLSCLGVFINGIEGESSYALNKNIIYLGVSEIPPDTVVLFETNFAGENPEERIDTRDRASGRYLYNEKLVRKGAWNQVGGAEILTCDHHAGLGCNILFADGHVEFVKKKDLPSLRWKP